MIECDSLLHLYGWFINFIMTIYMIIIVPFNSLYFRSYFQKTPKNWLNPWHSKIGKFWLTFWQNYLFHHNHDTKCNFWIMSNKLTCPLSIFINKYNYFGLVVILQEVKIWVAFFHHFYTQKMANFSPQILTSCKITTRPK